jgi:hypothetical protein
MLSNGNKAIPRWCGCKKQEYFEKNKDKINEYRRRKYAENKEAKNISLKELSLILIIIMPLSFSAGAPPSSWAPPLLQDGFGGSNLVHDTPTTMPCPCSEKSPSPREERGHWRRRRSAVGNTWAGWASIPVFFFLAWQVTRVSSYAQRPFPSKEIRRTSERDDPGPPVCHKNKRRVGV